MKPYFEFAKDQNNPNNVIGIKFNCGVSIAMFDYYCVNWDCDCTDITIAFVEMEENGALKERLFSLVIDTKTWKIDDEKIENEDLPCKEIIKEFKNGLTEELKAMFRKRIVEAKEYGRHDRMVVLKEEIGEESCLDYQEVFGDQELEKFCINYNGVDYFVDDQYCINPSCNCNAVTLRFFRIVLGRQEQEPFFTVKMPFTGAYQVEYAGKASKAEIKAIVDRFMEHQYNKLLLLKKRYDQMKQLDQKHQKRQGQPNGLTNMKKSQVGRNEPCPCGSEKKYKKCCGGG